MFGIKDLDELNDLRLNEFLKLINQNALKYFNNAGYASKLFYKLLNKY